VLSEAQEDQTEDRGGVFRGLEFGIGAEFVGCRPESRFQVVDRGHWSEFTTTSSVSLGRFGTLQRR